MEKLLNYFQSGVSGRSLQSIGMEVETSFVNSHGQPASMTESQEVFKCLVEAGWCVTGRKNALLISSVTDGRGNEILYELGRQNLELATKPSTISSLIWDTQLVLEELYDSAKHAGLRPRFEPILETNEDLLVIPDERDATWLALDGRRALAPLARISAVQFTIEVSLEQAVSSINQLGEKIGIFLHDYPQDEIWKEYIRMSKASYLPLRYGGPLLFGDLRNYCARLLEHDVVIGSRLVPYESLASINIPLYLRSVWWYFRLKRYGNRLCIEVRPLARRSDDNFETQLKLVLDCLNL